MMKNITKLTLSVTLTGNGKCRTAEKGTHIVNPYQWFTSPKPAAVAVTECWRCHFISASDRTLNMVLNITAISMRHSTSEARAFRNYRWQDSLYLPMRASVTPDTQTVRPERQETSPDRTGNSHSNNIIAILCLDNNTDSHMPLPALFLFYQQINVFIRR